MLVWAAQLPHSSTAWLPIRFAKAELFVPTPVTVSEPGLGQFAIPATEVGHLWAPKMTDQAKPDVSVERDSLIASQAELFGPTQALGPVRSFTRTGNWV